MIDLNKISKRGFVRIISFTAAAMVALGGAAYYGYNLSSTYKTELEYNYHRALNDLSDYMSNINLLLQKGSYATTSTALTTIAAELYRDTSSAKCCVSRLPVNDEYLANLNKFLSQAGEFSLELAKKTLRGDEVSDNDKGTLATLSATASDISGQISNIQSVASEKSFRTSNVAEDIQDGEPASMLQQMDSSINVEDEDSAIFPVLVYDGYYSDHIEGLEPKLTEGSSEITKDFAKELTAKMFGTDVAEIESANDGDGDIPCYGFSINGSSVCITKKGGYLLYYTNPRTVGEATLTYEQAIETAKKYLSDLGLGSFNADYYYVSEGVLNAALSFIDTSAGYSVICYPDVITVGVALDTGEVVNYNASEYILSHKSRDVSVIKYSAEDAQEKLSDNLTPTSSSLCVVSIPGYIEALCYEFICTGTNGETVQVFINANTLEEEKILLEIETAGGIFYK